MAEIIYRRNGNTVRRPKAFIPQEPMKKSDNGDMVSLMRFDKAAEYGDPVVCLPWGQVALATEPTMDALRDKLSDFKEYDYLIAVGDPTIIAMASMIIAQKQKVCNLLKWDKRAGRYFLCEVHL